MGCKLIRNARVGIAASSLYIVTWPQVTHFLTLWRLLLGVHFCLFIAIRLQNCLGCYGMTYFKGSYIEGLFLRCVFFHEGLLVLVWLLWQFRLTADARFANANCDFFVNFQKHCYVLAFPVGYLLRASFFETTFNFRHRHCCKVYPPSVAPWTDVILTE